MKERKKPFNSFKIISWAVTAVIVLVMAGLAVWVVLPTSPIKAPEPIASAETEITLPGEVYDRSVVKAIVRRADLTTVISTQETYEMVDYTVGRGDSLFGIANQYNIEPETLYWANFEVFGGSPDSLVPGDQLRIPPIDGVYYKWEEDDTFESIADEFGVEPEEIINWPGNHIDLTDPQVPVGGYVMVPGGTKDDQPLFITTITRTSSALAQACGGGFLGRGYFNWPSPFHTISGYDFGDGGGAHKAIDITAQEGTPIYAADTGVVTQASVGGWNYGYGNVVQIDHGNGFVTLYAHLSDVFVYECQSVLAGAVIGSGGNTGNSSGAHLHFEIRFNGVGQNPWFYLP